MNTIGSHNLTVCLVVDDTYSAQVASVAIGRQLQGVYSADDALAFEEQASLVERAIVDAGHSTDQALLATEHSSASVRGEWW